MTFNDCKNAGLCGKDLCIPEFCHSFDPIQKTNAECIREMSDEELAEMFLSACVYREFCYGCPAEKEMPNCPGEILGKWEEWLKQPAEVQK